MVQNSDIQLFIDDYNNDPNPSLNRETQQNGLIMYFAIQKISKKMMITLSPNSNYQNDSRRQQHIDKTSQDH